MNFVFDFQVLTLGLSLLCLIGINILLGSINAVIHREFDKGKLINGSIKGGIITFSFVACYFVGTLNPDVIIINANGQDLNLLTAINILILAGYVWYGKQVIEKLAGFINVKL